MFKLYFIYINLKICYIFKFSFFQNVEMKKFIFLLLIFLYIFPVKVEGKRLHKESEYQKSWCNKYNGILEYELDDKTRVDCLTTNFAVEVDFANKWAECVGQALYYGIRTNKEPACLLIIENGEKDLKYLKRLKCIADKKKIKTFIIKPEQL